MQLKNDENYWEYYRFTGDFFAVDIKGDAKEKFGDYLESEILLFCGSQNPRIFVMDG